MPVILNRKDKTDLQFMPEGGYLVAGIKSLVAFKAIGEDGKGCDVSGTVYDSENRTVTGFTSTHLGMGSFYLTPRAGEIYTAVFRLDNDQTKSFSLPLVKASGIVLQVRDSLKSDSVAIHIIATPDLQNNAYYLTGQSRGIGCFGAIMIPRNGKETLHISKNIFPTGIARLTLLNTDRHPLCSRIIFIDHHDELQMRITGKKVYTARDSVSMHIRVTDKKGEPVQGSFSVAVTDDTQVNIDTLRRSSLVSDILLTSDLKGYIEDPEYYFQSQMTEKKWRNLDNLLLTQGWVSYSPDTMKDGRPVYKAEQSFSVSGRVMNILNKPVAGSNVVLFSKKPFALRDTVTNPAGEFTFNDLYPVDTASYMIQARSKRGKSFNVGIELKEFKPPVFKPLSHRPVPWYVNIDTGSLRTVHTYIAGKEEADKLSGKHVLKEVVVVGQKVIKGSKNLNGPGGSDFVLNESDMQKEGKKTLKDVLREKVKGFRVGGKHLDVYMIYSELVHLIIDGVNLDFFKPDETYREYYDQYLNYLTAEDIKGIEVMTSPRYTMSYFQKFLNPLDEPFDHMFIEITTYSGNGAFMKKTPGVYLYRPPVAFSVPVEFYSPKYRVKTAGHSVDIRSTIYWKPDILTDKNGEAHISFYTADKPGTYTLILEGSDMNGRIGSSLEKITIK